MKRQYGITVFLIVTAILFSTFALACGEQKAAQPQQTGPVVIKVGLPTALSGPAAPWGQAGIDYYNAWIDLFNKEGFKIGDKTYNFQLITVDDESTPEGGAAAAKQLIYSDGCKALAGHWTWNYPTVSAVSNAAKVLLFTRTGNEAVPGGVYDPKTQPYTVFANPSHQQYLSDCLALVKAYPNYKRIGILDSNLGKGIGWDYIDQSLDAAGIRYHHEWFPPATVDFTPYITKYAEAGCDIIYSGGDITSPMLVAKQRMEMGYKDWHVGHAGPFVDPAIYLAVCGYEAAQGFLGQYWCNWEFKDTKVNPKYITMCQEVEKMVNDKRGGKSYVYTGWIGWLPSHLLIYSQAMEKAGTVDDPDAIMKAIRGGTFDSTTGKWTMSGAKTYGSPVVFGCPGCICQIQGEKEVYLSESAMAPIP